MTSAFKKIVKMLVRLCFVLCLAHLGSGVTVKNNAYRNLVISFAPEVNSEDGKEIVDNLKNLLESTSDVLRTAIGLRIADATFHLPASWDTSSWENVAVNPSSTPLVGKEDILVENVPDSAFGGRPFALQYSGCAVPGHKIVVQTNFLNDTEGYPKGKLLAREWLKYRYGVFDENGFIGDDMYPSYYQIPGTIDVKITECTDPEVEYDFKDTHGNNCSLEIPFATSDCDGHPNESSRNVTSSLMYFHQELTAVESVCGKNHTHKGFTPSKHNLLCNGKSIWEVLEMSSDFKNEEEATVAPEEDEEPGITFFYLQETKPRVVIAIENSFNLHKEGDLIIFALRRLIYDLPDGSDFGLYSYKNDLTSVRSLSGLTTDKDRELTIPVMFVDEVKDICVTCAITEAVTALEDKPDIQGSIILIADSTSYDADENLVSKLEELKLKERNLCLTVVAFTNSAEQNPPAVFEKLASSSNCISLSVLNKEETDVSLTFEKLHQAMLHAVPHPPSTSQTTMVTSGFMSSDNSLVIPMDITSHQYTLWLPKLLPTINIKCKAGDVDITLTTGVHSSSMASYFFPANEENVNCNLSSPALPPVFTLVEMTTKPGEFFKEEVWIHDTSESDDIQMPVIIFARLNFGNYPVRNAKVVASISGPNGDSLQELELFDNGKGDPDITQNDGIYSRYFVGFTGEGEYQVTVTATNENSTTFGKNGSDVCCGSKVKSESVELHPFERSMATSFSVKGKIPDEGYKPSRILDLRVDNYEPMTSIILKWTAPGGQADNGNATNYILKSFTKREDILTNEVGLSINVPNVPQNYGAEEEFPLPLDDFELGITHYLAIRSGNSAGNVSDISNVLEVFLPERPTKKDDETTDDPDPEKKQSGLNKKTVGIIIGCLVLVIVLVIVIYLLIYFFVRKPNRKEAKKRDSGGSNSTRNHASPPIGLNSIPADVILKHHNEVVTAKRDHKDPPIFKEENLDSVEQTPESLDDSKSNNSAEYSQVQKRQPEQENTVHPPKSPKRITNV